MISKELLNAVLGEEVEVNCKDFEGKHLQLFSCGKIWWKRDKYVKSINIYELAHMVKEWAYEKGYDVYTGIDDCHVIHREGSGLVYEIPYTLEPEAVFKAGQWVLENV